MRLPFGGWRFSVVALVAILALVALPACGDDEEEEATPTATPAETPAATPTPAAGGELTVATFEPDALDPHFSSFSQDISLQRMLWTGLYWLDANNVSQPQMAAALPEISADGRTYTITLKEGLLWSDGDDLKAEDFVMGILRTCNPVHAGEYQYVLTNLAGCDDHFGNEAGFDASLQNLVGVRAIDDLTLEITIGEPQPTFTIILSMWMTWPAPVHLFPNSSDPWPEPGPDAPGQLAYNGPYILTGYNPGDSAVLEPNPNWAGDIKPTLDTLTLRFIDDLAVANEAFRAGEVDFATVDEVQLPTIVSEFGPTGEYVKVEAAITLGLQMQLEKPPLDNLDVRLALARAFDREQLNEVVYGGGNTATTTWIPLGDGGEAPDAFEDVIGFDPDAARAHLEAAGYPNGEGFPVLTFLDRDSPTSRALTEFLQESFRTVLNIDTEIELVDAPTRSARFTSEDFELFRGGWIHDYPDPENWILGLFETGGTLNNYNCSNPQIDALVEDARFNTNDAERRQQYTDINRLISESVCGVAPFIHLANHYLIKSNVVGMVENASAQDAVIPGDWMPEAWGRSE